MNRFFIKFFLLSTVICGPIFSFDLGVRAQSFGGAFRAVATSNDIILINPAGLLKFRRLGIEADYSYGLSNKNSRLTFSILDSKTTGWGLGLLYSADLKPGHQEHLGYIAVAMPLGTDMISLGGSFSYAYQPSNLKYRHYFNSDIALMLNLPIGLTMAFVLDHLVKPKDKNEKSMGLSLATALELGKILPILPLTLSFDWQMQDIKSSVNLKQIFSFGAEFVLLSFVPIRAGFQTDQNSKYLSLGAGLSLPVVAIDAAFSQNFSLLKERFLGIALRFNI
jgi:hypothetical protein